MSDIMTDLLYSEKQIDGMDLKPDSFPIFQSTVYTMSDMDEVGEVYGKKERGTFTRGLETLTPTERVIYSAYLAGKSSKDIMSELNIKENTLKFHNKNLYSKLGVSSRKQLLHFAALKQQQIHRQRKIDPAGGYPLVE